MMEQPVRVADLLECLRPVHAEIVHQDLHCGKAARRLPCCSACARSSASDSSIASGTLFRIVAHASATRASVDLDDDARTLGGQRLRNRQADPCRRTGDQGEFTLQLEIHAVKQNQALRARATANHSLPRLAQVRDEVCQFLRRHEIVQAGRHDGNRQRHAADDVQVIVLSLFARRIDQHRLRFVIRKLIDPQCDSAVCEGECPLLGKRERCPCSARGWL